MIRRAMVSFFVVNGCADDGSGRTRLVCEAAVEGQPRPLIDHDLWRLAEPREDPWAQFRPEDVACPEGARQAEDFAGTYAYSVVTSACPYTTVTQMILADVCAGESFYIWLWNYALTAPENAIAHIGVKVGTLEWSTTRAIPGPSNLVAEAIKVPEDIPQGTPVYFHVRNHGTNSYELLDLVIVAPGDAPSPP